MPKGTSSRRGGLLGHQLAHAGDTEGGLFNGLGHHVKGFALHLLEGVVDHAGAGDAHVDDALRLPRPVEGAGHEGVILHGVGRRPPAWRSRSRPGRGGALGGRS